MGLFAQSPEQPQLALMFRWDDSLQTWGDTSARVEHSYLGNLETPALTLESFKYQGIWKLRYRNSRQFDDAGNVLVHTREKMENGQWEPFNETIWTYDAQGNVTEIIYLNDLGFGYDTTGIEFYSNTYDSFGNLTEISLVSKYYGDPGFEPYWKDIRTYDANNELVTREFQYWQNQSWRTSWFRKNHVWHDYAQDQAAEYQTNWYNLSPTVQDSVLYVFDWGQNGSHTEYRFLFDPLFFQWDSITKHIRNFDNHGHPTLNEKYVWEDSLNAFALDFGDRHVNYHNADGHLSAYDFQQRGYSGGSFQNIYRWEFYNFFVGLSEQVEEGKWLRWGPHPVGESGNLVMDLPRSGKFQLQLFDLQGKGVRDYRGYHSGGLQNHDFNLALPAGVYTYLLQIHNLHATGKLTVRP